MLHGQVLGGLDKPGWDTSTLKCMFNGETLRGVVPKVKIQSEGGRRPCDKVCVACVAELCVEVAERTGPV